MLAYVTQPQIVVALAIVFMGTSVSFAMIVLAVSSWGKR